MKNELLQKETLAAVETALTAALAQIMLGWDGWHIENRDLLVSNRGSPAVVPLRAAEAIGEGLLELAVHRGYLECISAPRCPRRYRMTKLGKIVGETHPLIITRNQAAMVRMVERARRAS